MAKKSSTRKNPQPSPTPSTTSSVVGPVVTLATIELMRTADSLESAVRLLAPSTRTRVDATYTLNPSCDQPLPTKRGVGLKVVAAAARINGPFKVSDITAALPDVKSARFWVGRLVRSGHFVVAE